MATSCWQLEEFTSCIGDATLFYKLLKMEGSMFIWIGTEAGSMDSLIASYAARLSGSPATASTLLGPIGEGQYCQMANRLQERTGLNILLSANISNDELALHVEEQLVERLSL